MKYPDFSKARVGDRVYDVVDGWGTITDINSFRDCPIIVRFDTGESDSFMFDGRATEDCLYASIYWNEIPIPEESLQPPKRKKRVFKYVFVFFRHGQWRVSGLCHSYEEAKDFMLNFDHAQGPFGFKIYIEE